MSVENRTKRFYYNSVMGDPDLVLCILGYQDKDRHIVYHYSHKGLRPVEVVGYIEDIVTDNEISAYRVSDVPPEDREEVRALVAGEEQTDEECVEFWDFY